MISKYILDYSSSSPTYEPDTPELREERPIDKILRPTADRYILWEDIKPILQDVVNFEYYDTEHLNALQKIRELLES